MTLKINRRAFGAGLAGVTLAVGAKSVALSAIANDVGRIAIIDTPDNAATVADQIREKSVRVVARYYARERQRSLPNKIMSADENMIGGEREPAVLIAKGFSIVSTYQYMNNLPDKFIRGLPDTGGSPEKEVAADAKAALQQAALVKQPEGTAIYFGVDFNLTQHRYLNGKLVRVGGKPVENSEQIDAVLNYFRTLKKTVGNHYALGVYGNGFANRLLREAGLIKYSWISNSRSFEETSTFYNSGTWHLFQNQVDRRWFEKGAKCPSGLDIDTNIQNPVVADIGAWGNGGVDRARTKAVFEQRRFATRVTSVFRRQDGSGGLIGRVFCRYHEAVPHWRLDPENAIGRNANARILAQSGHWVAADVDDDGLIDGYVSTADLTADFTRMPAWDQLGAASGIA